MMTAGDGRIFTCRGVRHARGRRSTFRNCHRRGRADGGSTKVYCALGLWFTLLLFVDFMGLGGGELTGDSGKWNGSPVEVRESMVSLYMWVGSMQMREVVPAKRV